MVSTVRKLTEPDKHEILKLYRETAETTSTLAERYDVSNSTISRLLKSTLPEDEYEYLVSLKRAARTPEGRAQVSYDNLPAFSNQSQEDEKQEQKALEPEVSQTVVEIAPLQVPQTPKSSESPAAAVVLPQEEPVVAQNLQLVEVDEPTHASRRVKRRSSAETKPILPVRAKQYEQPYEQPVAEQLELLEQNPEK